MFQELAKVNIHLIIDKSLFQSLPKKAFTPLDRYFYLVIPPILIKEILGDLGKNTSPEIIAGLADRFGMHSIVCQDHRFLLANSLIGNETSMDGRIPPAGMTPVVTADGMAGYNVRRTPEDAAIQRWQRKDFSVQEAFWAYKWQSIKKFINTSLYVNRLEDAGASIKVPKNIGHLHEMVDEIIGSRTLQGTLLGLIHTEFQVPREYQVQSMNRWFALKKPLLKDSSPYAAFCLKANLLLALGNLDEKILGRQDIHDLRDLEYCYYLPFCEVFASEDKIHRKLIQSLLRPNQDLVGAEFSLDLRRLGEEWFSLSKDEKILRHSEFGSNPPPNEASAVYLLSEKRKAVREKQKQERPKQKKIPPVPTEKIRSVSFPDFLKEMTEKINNTRPTLNSVEDGSFLQIKRMVSRAKLEEMHPGIDFDETRDT